MKPDFVITRKSAVFIDGANIYQCNKGLGFMIDWDKFREFFASRENLLRLYYYTAVMDRQAQQENGLIRMLDYLSNNGYQVVTKPVKIFMRRDGEKLIKGNMDIDMTVQMFELAIMSDIEHFIIATGDGDFVPVVKFLQQRGRCVTIISSAAQDSSVCSTELRHIADNFIDINEHKLELGRNTD